MKVRRTIPVDLCDRSRSLLGKEASWERVLITFEKYAIDFKKRYGSVPVLIVDNCELLANKDPQMLEILQEAAKRAIDDSTWITVFVASVGNAPEQMEGRSSITRASSFFLISDLTEEEAMTYLVEKRGLTKNVAKDLYDLFGGRIKSLQNAASKIESGSDFLSKSCRILKPIDIDHCFFSPFRNAASNITRYISSSREDQMSIG